MNKIFHYFPGARLFWATFFICFGGTFHFGYQQSVFNPTESVFRTFFNGSFSSHYHRYLSDQQFRFLWAVFIGLFMFGALVGTLFMPLIADKFGRKRALYFSNLTFIIGCIPSAVAKYANSFELMICGRLLMGIGTGLTTGFQSLYLTEISPNRNRGFLNSMSEFLLEIGFLLGSVIALGKLLGNEDWWPILFWLETIPSILALTILPFLPESPKYLLSKNREIEARASLLFYSPYLKDDSLEQDNSMAEIQREIEMQQKSLGFRAVWKVKLIRKALLLGCLANFIVPFSGVNAIDFFAVYILELVGLSETTASYTFIVVAFSVMVGSAVSTVVTDKVGRRPLLINSLAVLTVGNVLFMTFLALHDAYSWKWLGYLCVIVMIVFNFAFGMGPGTVQWFLTAEMVPQNARSSAQRVTNIVQWVSNFVGTTAFFPLQGAIGPYSYFMFIVPLVLTVVVLHLYLPESKNLSAEEIRDELALGIVQKKKSRAKHDCREKF